MSDGAASEPPSRPHVEGRSCASCGARARANARFCASCGQPLPAPARASSGTAAETRCAADATTAPAPRELAVSRRHRRIERPESLAYWETFRGAFALWATLLGTLGLGSLVAIALEAETPSLDLAVTLVAAAIVLAFCWQDRRSLAPLLRASGFTWSTWWCAPLVCALMAGLFELYFGALQSLGLPLARMIESYEHAGWPLWTAFLLISLAPGIFEELAFRGVIQTRLAQVMRPGEAMLVQAGMFSVLHLNPLIFLSHFAMGLGLGWLRERTQSLYPGMLLHAAWNAFVLLEELR